MLEIAQQVLSLLSRRERCQAALLMLMILVMAALEVAGVASIMPFIALLANPDIIKSSRYFRGAFDYFGFTSTNDFLFAVGVTVFGIFLFSTLFKALTTYALSRFTYMRDYSIGRRLLAGYLHQPYEWFLNRNSADLGKTLLSEVDKVVVGAVIPLMQLFAQAVVGSALIVLLLVVNPLLAACVGSGFAIMYGLIYGVLRARIRRLGSHRTEANRKRFELVNEAFGGIKEIKVGGLEDVFVARFDAPAHRVASSQVIAQHAMNLPRFALEIVAFGGMLLISLYLMRTSGSFASALPVIALYAFAGYRLLPAFQQSYLYLSLLRFAGPALEALHGDLQSFGKPTSGTSSFPTYVRLADAIRLEDVHYSYPSSSLVSLRGVSIEIPACTTVGLVGATGSGKSTLIDVMLGLLRPQQGNLYVDNAEITPENLRSWQRSIGYVPQHIFLADDTIAANIAFGVRAADVDQAAIEQAARVANLQEFVANELPQGYDTVVGERGVRLSGGQRQRIGIARALYHRPQLLVLDEATSALDTITEKAVMEAVHRLRHEMTVVLVAHRLSTVRDCDRIYLLEKGHIVEQGTFEDLVARSGGFREMAKA